MLDVTLLRQGRARDAQPGSLFVSLAADDRRTFITGRWEDSDVLVELETMSWRPKNDCPVPPGYLVPGIRFEVDEKAAVLANEDRPSGSLFLLDGHLGIFLVPRPTDRYFFAANSDEPLPRKLTNADLFFPSWRIVVGSEDRPMELFNTSGRTSPWQAV